MPHNIFGFDFFSAFTKLIAGHAIVSNDVRKECTTATKTRIVYLKYFFVIF